MDRPAALKHTTLAVLAGGEGSRMGRPKAQLHVSGKPILRHLLDRLAWPGPTLLVSAPGRVPAPATERFDREVFDAVAGEGPLRGVLTALQNATTESVLVIAVDMPAIRHDDLAWYVDRLMETPDALGVMARNRAGQIEPLPCALRVGIADAVDARLKSGRRALHSLADDPRVRVINGKDCDPRTWMNANTPAEWDRLVSDLGQ